MQNFKHILITGTGTDIGKTIISAMLVQAYNGSYFKPYQSGTIEADDTCTVKELTKLSDDHFFEPIYRFKAPLSPHAAAKLEDIIIDPDNFYLPNSSNGPIFIESAGGPLVPLNNQSLFIDTITPIPSIIVSENKLGTINNTLSTIEILKNRKFPILGVIFNGNIPSDIHKNAIESFGKVPVLGQIPHLTQLNSNSLQQTFDQYLKNLEALCPREIQKKTTLFGILQQQES